MSLHRRWHSCLEELREQGRFRRLALPHGVDFSSNDYLGYGKRTRHGTADLSHSGQSSRLLRGHHALWDEVEAALARWHGCEAALIMHSGYTANEGLLATVIEPDDFLASDERNHASIIDGAKLSRAERFVFRHNDLDHLEEGLRQAARQRGQGRELFVVTEALFSMAGDRAPLRDIADLADKYQTHLIVDEAHSTGCFGPGGSGLVDELGLRDRVLATMHTGGKALGVCGAYVAGSRLLRELLLNRCRPLIFATALPPVIASWWLEILPRVQGDQMGRERLRLNTALFRAELAAANLEALGADHIVPVVLGEDGRAMRAAEELQAEGFDIRAIRPPTVPEGTARLRVSLHADHREEDLRAVAACLRKIVTRK